MQVRTTISPHLKHLCNAIFSNDHAGFNNHLRHLNTSELNTVFTITDRKGNINHINTNILFLAISYDLATECVRNLLEKGADPNLKNTTPGFVLACKYGPLELVDLFLLHKANPNLCDPMGLTPLHYAAQDGQLVIVRRLIEGGAIVNSKSLQLFTPLTLAAKNGHVSTVRLLCESGADVNHEFYIERERSGPLILAVGGDHHEVLKILLAHVDASKLLAFLVDLANLATIMRSHKCQKIIKEKCVQTNLTSQVINGRLSKAIISNHPLLFNALIQEMTDVNGFVPQRLAKDPKTEAQVTLLYIAAQLGYMQYLKTLLASGANPNLGLNGTDRPPLAAAASNNCSEAVAELCQHPDIDLNFAHLQKINNPLFCAVDNNDVNSTKHILEAMHRRKIILNSSHYDAFIKAIDKANPNIIRLFCQHGFPILTRCMDSLNALLIAVQCDKPESITSLLDALRERYIYKAQVEKTLSAERCSLNHLLMFAYIYGSKQAAQALIKAGADGTMTISAANQSIQEWCLLPGKETLPSTQSECKEYVINRAQNMIARTPQCQRYIEETFNMIVNSEQLPIESDKALHSSRRKCV